MASYRFLGSRGEDEFGDVNRGQVMENTSYFLVCTQHCFVNFRHSGECVMVSMVILICISMISNTSEHFFLYLLVICIFCDASLFKCFTPHPLTNLAVSLMIEVQTSLFLNTNPLSGICVVNIFFQACLFIFSMVSLKSRSFKFRWSPIYRFFPLCLIFFPKKSLPNSMLQRFFSYVFV